MRLFELINAEKANYYPISVLSCSVLKVSRSGYYAWKDRLLSKKRARERASLTEKIKEINNRSRQI